MRIKPRKFEDSITSNLKAGDWRYETFEQRPHLVVPVVLMTEGVHNGSNGPFLYSEEELSTLAASWNGVPVPIFHPEDNGSPCTCNDPRVIERQNVGRMFNVRWENGKLKGEAWIDIQKAESVYNGIIDMIKDQKSRLEVSTGLLAEHDMTPGVWNGEEYDGVIRNIRPDHLALLPGSRGACSWEDGCGVRNMDKNVEKYLNNLMGQRETHQKIYQFVDSMDNDMSVHFLEEVYDDYFIYRKETRTQNQGAGYYKVPYTLGEDGTLNVDSNGVSQVKKSITYESISNNQEKGEEDMATRKDGKGADTQNTECPECKAVIDELIANESTQFTEENRDFLDEMDLETLKLFRPVQKEEKDPVVNKEEKKETPPDTNKEEEEKEKPLTARAYIDNAPAEIREVLNSAMNTHQNRKKDLVAQITANARNKFSKEQLTAKPLEELEMLAELATDVNYEGQGGASHTQNEEKEEPLFIPVVDYSTKK